MLSSVDTFYSVALNLCNYCRGVQNFGLKKVPILLLRPKFHHKYHCLQKGPYFKDLVLNKDLFWHFGSLLGPYLYFFSYLDFHFLF